MTSFGSIRYNQGTWQIACEPHVKARLKRVFPRVSQMAAPIINLTATPENSRELEWFLQRYPMDIDKPELLRQFAQEHTDTELRLADLLAARAAPREINLAIPPRDYQRFAAEMLEVKGGYLPRQWAAMIKQFAPELSVHVIKKGSVYPLVPKRKGQQQALFVDTLPDVIITSYHKLRGWAETLAGLIHYVVFDECQALRSPGTQIHAAARMVANNAPRRIGLSATPIYNYGGEFFHVVDVLAPGALGSHAEFIREWCTSAPGEKSRIGDTKEFGAYLRREGIMLRRTRAEVGRELPDLSKIIHEIDADQEALDKLQGDAVALARIVLTHNERFRGEKMQAAGELDAIIRQATGIAKAPYVAEFVKLLLDNDEPVVLFGWHRDVYSMWLEALSEFNPVMYTGTESANQKAESIAAFTEGKTRLLIMSLRSGAGVDGLQGYCRTVVFGELDWSPGVHEQCVGRVHRDGQDEPCAAYFLVSESGSDPIMAEVLGIKREQIEGVRNPDSALAERIDTGENNIRRLAREFLQRRGIEHVEPTVATIQEEREEAEL